MMGCRVPSDDELDACLPSLPSPGKFLRQLSFIPSLFVVAAGLWLGGSFLSAFLLDGGVIQAVYRDSRWARLVVLAVFIALYTLFWWSYFATMFTHPGMPPDTLAENAFGNEYDALQIVTDSQGKTTSGRTTPGAASSPPFIPISPSHRTEDTKGNTYIHMSDSLSSQSTGSAAENTGNGGSDKGKSRRHSGIDNRIDTTVDYGFMNETVLTRVGLVAPLEMPMPQIPLAKSRQASNSNNSDSRTNLVASEVELARPIPQALVETWTRFADKAARQYIQNNLLPNAWGSHDKVHSRDGMMARFLRRIGLGGLVRQSSYTNVSDVEAGEEAEFVDEGRLITDEEVAAACGVDIPNNCELNTGKTVPEYFATMYTGINSSTKDSDAVQRFRYRLENSKATFMTFPIEAKLKETARFCKKCNRWKPDRAHHCSTCGVCILKMDHHCPWINTCIGFKNYKLFILFLTYSFLATLYIFVIFAHAVFFASEGVDDGDLIDIALNNELNTMFVIFLSATFCFCMILFLAVHVRYVIVNSTTIESMELGTLITGVTTYKAIRDVFNSRRSLLKPGESTSNGVNEGFNSVKSFKTNLGKDDDTELNKLFRGKNRQPDVNSNYGPFTWMHAEQRNRIDGTRLVLCESIHLYNCGLRSNWFQIFGRYGKTWMWPTAAQDIGDGLVYPVSTDQLNSLLNK